MRQRWQGEPPPRPLAALRAAGDIRACPLPQPLGDPLDRTGGRVGWLVERFTTLAPGTCLAPGARPSGLRSTEPWLGFDPGGSDDCGMSYRPSAQSHTEDTVRRVPRAQRYDRLGYRTSPCDGSAAHDRRRGRTHHSAVRRRQLPAVVCLGPPSAPLGNNRRCAQA
jgi:hypothetical protein